MVILEFGLFQFGTVFSPSESDPLGDASLHLPVWARVEGEVETVAETEILGNVATGKKFPPPALRFGITAAALLEFG